MERILVSACLLGQPVRFDGTGRRSDDALFERWRREGRLVPFCPEVRGGLPVPRPPAEISGGSGADVLDGRAAILTPDGTDVTRHFVLGARRPSNARGRTGSGSRSSRRAVPPAAAPASTTGRSPGARSPARASRPPCSNGTVSPSSPRTPWETPPPGWPSSNKADLVRSRAVDLDQG
jgi:hypothetical protein